MRPLSGTAVSNDVAGTAAVAASAPVACGALGEFDDTLASKLANAFGGPLGEIHRDERSVLWLDREPLAWEGSAERGLGWSEHVPARAAAGRTWREAGLAGAVGLAFEGDQPAVHGSVSGTGPLYWMQVGRAAYFATAIHPLTRIAPGTLTPDWEAWASILILGFPNGDRTPFSEIRRLAPMARLETANGAAHATHGELVWVHADLERDPDVAAERVVAALREEVRGLEAGTDIRCLLSGGLDSRLLFALLAERGDIELSGWTIDTEERADDVSLAAGVAAKLGRPHFALEPQDPPFSEELREAAARVDYESMLQLPMARAAAAMEPGGPVVFGLAANGLVTGLQTNWSRNGDPLGPSAVAPMFESFVSSRSQPFAREPGARLYDVARTAFMAEARHFGDHPAAPQLTFWWNRGRRAIGPASQRVLGERHEVVAPFVADAVAAAGIGSVPARLTPQRILRVANAEVARLPSSDEAPSPRARDTRAHERSRQARREFVSVLRRSPMRPWFSRRLDQRLEEGRLGAALRRHVGLRRVQMLASLTLWAERYADVIGDPDPSPLLGEPPRPGR